TTEHATKQTDEHRRTLEGVRGRASDADAAARRGEDTGPVAGSGRTGGRLADTVAASPQRRALRRAHLIGGPSRHLHAAGGTPARPERTARHERHFEHHRQITFRGKTEAN